MHTADRVHAEPDAAAGDHYEVGWELIGAISLA